MMHRVLRLSLVGLLASAVLAAHAQGLRLPGTPAASLSGGAQQASDFIVAVVNSEPITNLQLRQEMERLAQQLAQTGQPVPDQAEMAQQVLERLISDRTQLQLARETGIKIDESALDESEKAVARQNRIDVEEMYRRLTADGVSRSQFRANLRDQMILSRVREREVGRQVKVSELDVDRYLLAQQANSGSAMSEVNIAHILVAVPEAASAAQLATAQAKAQRVMDRARAGEDFSALARELSDAPDAREGGLFGLRPVDRYPALFTDAVRERDPGSVVMVRSGAGLHVLKLIDKRAGGMPSTTAVRTRVSHILLRPTAALSESAALAKLNDFRTRILAGQADFATLAKENSQDGSAAQGGDLGWSVAGQFVPEFEAVMADLAPGQIAAPMVSRFGVHLIKVTDRETVKLGEREQREAVRAMLREKKYEEVYLAWASELRARAYVDMREPPR